MRHVKCSTEECDTMLPVGDTICKPCYDSINADGDVTRFNIKDGQNTCDKCNIIMDTNFLIWISGEDFEPFKGEELPQAAYNEYQGLCEECYQNLLIVSK